MAKTATKGKKKATVKAAAKPAAKSTSVKKNYKEAVTKTELLATIADATSLAKKEVSAVLDTLSEVIAGHLGKRAIGHITVPGLLKIEVKKKPAKKARKGINPFTGEETMFKAKPASRGVKIKALKKLKEMAE